MKPLVSLNTENGTYRYEPERDMLGQLAEADRKTNANLRRGHPLVRGTQRALPVLPPESRWSYLEEGASIFQRFCEVVQQRLLNEDGEVRVHLYASDRPKTQVWQLNAALRAKFQSPRVKFIEVDPEDFL